ncbi:MAG: hypothetical protein AB1486_23115 [Planctomycetota bacterium]
MSIPELFRIESRLAKGEIVLHFRPPPRTPARTLRLRVPDGWSAQSARVLDEVVEGDVRGTMELRGLREPFTLNCEIRRR